MRNFLVYVVAGFIGGLVVLVGPTIMNFAKDYKFVSVRQASASATQTVDSRPMPVPRRPIAKAKKGAKLTCSGWQQPMFGGKPYKVCTRRG